MPPADGADQERLIWVGDSSVAESVGWPGNEVVVAGGCVDVDSVGVAEDSDDTGLIPTEFIAYIR